MQTIDWNRTYRLDQWNTGEVRVTYQVPLDMTEEKLRENMLYWDMDNIWTIFKLYRISPDLMREIQSNLTKKDIKELEHEMMIDCLLPRQCFVQQIENYLTYMRECKICFEGALKDKQNKQKLLIRLNKMMSSYSVHRDIASFVDCHGSVTDQIVF